MEIKNFRIEPKGRLTTACATVVWEDSGRKQEDVYFGTTGEFAGDLTAAPEAFLLGCALPAVFLGEKRIKINGEICSSLKQGIETNLQTFRKWYGPQYQPIPIEAPPRKSSLKNCKNRAALFLSGGIDSLYSLRINRLKVPFENTLSVKDCFVVHGFDIGYEDGRPEDDIVFERALRSLKSITDDAKTSLISVYTNIRRLHNDLHFWEKCFHGAALAAVAHCFTSRINRVTIASSHAPENLEPWGSHPKIDSNYSSRDFYVIHDELFPRFKKTKVVADWDVALDNLRVCTSNKEDLLNCGKCRKCLRTKVQLLALGKLAASKAFVMKEIPLEDFRGVVKSTSHEDFEIHYLGIVNDLQRQGRHDIADIIMEDTGWKSNIRRWDAAYLNGCLTQGWGLIRRLTLP